MSLNWFESVGEMMTKAAEQSGMNVYPLYSGPFPFVLDGYDEVTKTAGPRQEIELTNSKIFKVEMGSDQYTVVVLCRMVGDKPNWTIYCGDGQVKGDYRNDGKTLASKLRREGKTGTKLANALEASEWVAKTPTVANCGFFRMLQRGKYCSHTQQVLSSLSAPDLEEMAPQLASWLAGEDSSVSAVAEALSEEEETFYDAAFVQHVLLAGERGSGKTFLARQAADKYDAVYLEAQMHPSMEAWELRSHDRAWNGKVYTVMGPLSEAVYWIEQGKKVVLCFDEFLNMNPVYQTVVNSPLTLTANDTYRIDTGEIVDMGDGIGRPKVVEVPADMLWVVATSNIGARYGLDKIAPSVRARFQIVLMNTNPERTKSIIEKNLAQYDMPIELADMFRKFIEACHQAVLENTLDEEATTRLACNVLRACHKKAKRDGKKYSSLRAWLPVVKKQVMAEIAQVVNFELGPLDEGQKDIYKSYVDLSFKAPR